MAHTLPQALLTRPFNYGMQHQAQPLEHLCKDTLIQSDPLHSLLMAHALPRALLTKAFDYGM